VRRRTARALLGSQWTTNPIASSRAWTSCGDGVGAGDCAVTTRTGERDEVDPEESSVSLDADVWQRPNEALGGANSWFAVYSPRDAVPPAMRTASAR
jgi:hypothetical protein